MLPDETWSAFDNAQWSEFVAEMQEYKREYGRGIEEGYRRGLEAGRRAHLTGLDKFLDAKV